MEENHSLKNGLEETNTRSNGRFWKYSVLDIHCD